MRGGPGFLVFMTLEGRVITPDIGVPFAVDLMPHTPQFISSSNAPFPGEDTKAHIQGHRASQATAEATTDFAPSFCELHRL